MTAQAALKRMAVNVDEARKQRAIAQAQRWRGADVRTDIRDDAIRFNDDADAGLESAG